MIPADPGKKSDDIRGHGRMVEIAQRQVFGVFPVIGFLGDERHKMDIDQSDNSDQSDEDDESFAIIIHSGNDPKFEKPLGCGFCWFVFIFSAE